MQTLSWYDPDDPEQVRRLEEATTFARILRDAPPLFSRCPKCKELASSVIAIEDAENAVEFQCAACGFCHEFTPEADA